MCYIILFIYHLGLLDGNPLYKVLNVPVVFSLIATRNEMDFSYPDPLTHHNVECIV